MWEGSVSGNVGSNDGSLTVPEHAFCGERLFFKYIQPRIEASVLQFFFQRFLINHGSPAHIDDNGVIGQAAELRG